MTADSWGYLEALGLACCVVVAISYVLSQWSLIRRWLMGERTFAVSLSVSFLLGLVATVGEFLVPPFAQIPQNVRYLAPLVGGLYGGPLVGMAASFFMGAGQMLVRGTWPGVEAVVPLVVGLVTGLLSRATGYKVTLGKAALIAVAGLSVDAILHVSVETEGILGWNELYAHVADLLTILIVARIFDNERAEEEHRRLLEDWALTDGLTRLANHRHFHTQLAKEIESARARGSEVAVVMLDLDYFKNYNDAFGHSEGDKLLAAVGEAIRAVIREGDTGARYGGDEFTLILPNTGFEGARAAARRIQEAANRHLRQNAPGKKAGIALSAGVAVYPTSATDKDGLIKRADEALYAAKYSESKVEVYHSVFDDLKAQLDSSELSLINTVKTLLTVINAKDRYTYGHSERVVNHCLIIARHLDLSDEQVKLLRIAAFLHDIGKIEIARDILNKEGKLTPAERQIIQLHPVWGADIIQPVRSLRQVVPTVLHHHERYDGTGYPDGLKGDEIPWTARILTVADSFDAMTTERPYQHARTIPEALAELKRCSGTQFDPWAVDAFAAALVEEPPARWAAGGR